MQAIANGMVGQVLAGPLFLRVKQNSLLQKQVINKSTRVILDLLSLLYYNMVDRKSIWWGGK